MNQERNNTAESPFCLSSEIRWFMGGDVPIEILDWYRRSHHKHRYPTRTDMYLLYPHAKTIGVKFREDKFEIKSFVRALDTLSIGDHIKGDIELWEKWSLAGYSVSQLFSEIRGDKTSWIDVTKTRTIRKYSTDGEVIHEMDALGRQGFPDDGCNVELTEITIKNKSYWSIGFEAFATRKDLKDNLLQTFVLLFESYDIDFKLAEDDSFSYPTFLGKIRSDKFY
jgi:hypothetical protein